MYPPTPYSNSMRARESRFFESHRDLVQTPAALVEPMGMVRRTVFKAPMMSPLGSGGNGGGVIRWDPQAPLRLVPLPRCRRINPARDPLYFTPHPNHVVQGVNYAVRGWRRPSYPLGTDPQMLAQLESDATYAQPYATRGRGTVWRPFTWMF